MPPPVGASQSRLMIPAKRSRPADERDRPAVVAAVRELLGLPFSIGCRDGRAVDCGGLVVHAAERCKYVSTDVPAGYTRQASAGLALYVHMRQCCHEIEPSAVAAGDVLMFWVRRRDFPQHLGVWTGESLVHATPRQRRVVESQLGNLASRVFAAFRLALPGELLTHTTPLHSAVECERCVLEQPRAFAYPGLRREVCRHV